MSGCRSSRILFLLLNYTTESVLTASETADFIYRLHGRLGLPLNKEGSRPVRFPLLQKPDGHVPQRVLCRTRLIREAFRRGGMAEVTV